MEYMSSLHMALLHLGSYARESLLPEPPMFKRGLFRELSWHPTATMKLGMSRVTIAPALTTALTPMVTPGSRVELAPTRAPFRTCGPSYIGSVRPIYKSFVDVTSGLKKTSSGRSRRT